VDYPPALLLPLMAALAAASFFFAGAESALFTLGPWRAKRLADGASPAGRRISALLARPDDVLATLALGNTVANAALVALGLQAVARHGWSAFAFGAAIIVLLVFLCEVAPKALAVRHPERWAVVVATPLGWLVDAVTPVRLAGQRIVNQLLKPLAGAASKVNLRAADDEVEDLLELAHEHGAIGAVEKEIILRVLSLDHRTAREVMRPRSTMMVLPDNLDRDAMIAAARRHRHHRIPLYDESPDTIIAVLNTRTLLMGSEPGAAADGGVDDAIEFPSFVPESMNLLKLFEALQRQRRGMAVVVDEFGAATGLVTLEDIVEAVVGPLRGEGEAPGFVVEPLGPSSWRVNGATRIDDFRRFFPGLPEDPNVETMGGLAVKLAEIVPPVGWSGVHKGLRFTVKVADERRVRELLVEKTGGAP
jgi:putative hemolysin